MNRLRAFADSANGRSNWHCLITGSVAFAICGCVLLTSSSIAQSAQVGAVNDSEGLFISGLAPDRRPDSAPTITTFKKTEDWYRRALKGVDKPYPKSLRFLENQEAWYVPFVIEGMVDRYDIRGMHK